MGALGKSAREYRAFRISPGDSNRLALIVDPGGEAINFVACVEIFDEGGRTPPNIHRQADEFFFVLEGEGRARCDGETMSLHKGGALLVRAGAEHVIENTGPGRLYLLTVMVPDEAFAALIRGGCEVPLDAQDLAVLEGA